MKPFFIVMAGCNFPYQPSEETLKKNFAVRQHVVNVASSYNSQNAFMLPLSRGGGIRTIDDFVKKASSIIISLNAETLYEIDCRFLPVGFSIVRKCVCNTLKECACHRFSYPLVSVRVVSLVRK